MATLCVDCSVVGSCAKPPNPQCPTCAKKCPFYWPHTSEVVRASTAVASAASPPRDKSSAWELLGPRNIFDDENDRGESGTLATAASPKLSMRQ